jgi:hypothetical protein
VDPRRARLYRETLGQLCVCITACPIQLTLGDWNIKEMYAFAGGGNVQNIIDRIGTAQVGTT